MKLLEAKPTAGHPPPAEDAPEAPAPEATAARACASCGAAMQAAQDWCLECGTAAPGRLGARPGWRAASTVVGLTLLLVLGAVAASYAALTSESTEVASRLPGPSAAPIAQPAPSLPAAPAPPVPTTETPEPEDLPEVDAPPAGGSDAEEPLEIDPPAADPTPSVTPGTTPSGDTDTDTTDPGDDGDEPTGPTALAVAEDAGSIYDPYGRATKSNAASRALDGDASTSWFGRAPDDAETMGFGFLVDLDDPADVRELLLRTGTPGFRVEVYGTTSRELPPDVLDGRWIHLRDRADIDASVGGAPKDGNTSGDGEERITLGDAAKGKRLRHLLLWFTQVPENGPTIRLGEVELRA